MDNYKAWHCNQIIGDKIRQGFIAPVFNAVLEQARDNDCFYYRTDGDGQLIAFAMGRLLKRSRIFALDKIGVAPNHRRRGLGSELITEIFDKYDRPIRVDVVSTNLDAISFYQRLGFNAYSHKVLGKRGQINITVMMKERVIYE